MNDCYSEDLDESGGEDMSDYQYTQDSKIDGKIIFMVIIIYAIYFCEFCQLLVSIYEKRKRSVSKKDPIYMYIYLSRRT